jgi:predicted transposase YbfD/YdcC
MPALPSSLISSLSDAPALTVPETAGGLCAALVAVRDPRSRRGVRHQLAVVVTAAVCAVVAGYRSYSAIAEWIADVPDTTVQALGIAADRRPSEAMIRRLLQALDPDLLTTVISAWLASRPTAEIPASRRAIAVDGKTLRGSRTADTAADHVMAACDQTTGVVLASTDVDGKTNEITRFQPLLDQISDLRDTVITADAMHCQRDHVTYLAERGAHWILTAKGNQPHLHKQLAGLPWKAVPDAVRDDDRRHGLREIRRRLDQPKRFTTETVYANTDLRTHQAKPQQLAAWIRGHWSIENKIPLGARRHL